MIGTFLPLAFLTPSLAYSLAHAINTPLGGRFARTLDEIHTPL
jgi:hypothetical protein